MRTKSLCLAAALLAGGALAASAQGNVYSLNVVGYVNTVMKGADYTLVANPLNAPTNDLNSLLGALPAKSTVTILSNGVTYLTSLKGATWSPNFNIPPGTGFFVKNFGASPVTNTFVGEVAGGIPGTNSTALPLGYVLVGSKIPVGGTLNDSGSNTLNLVNAVAAKSTVTVFDNSTTPGTYLTSLKGTTFSPNFQINVGQGFFIKAFTAGSNWVQVLAP